MPVESLHHGMPAQENHQMGSFPCREEDQNVSVETIALKTTDGLTLCAQRWTSKQNQPSPSKRRVLCLHGFLDNCQSFKRLAPRLCSSSIAEEVVAMDFPGHGKSTHHAADFLPNTCIGDYVYYVTEAVHALGWQELPFALIGHSMGAIVAVMYAAAFPEHVEKLVLLDGCGPDFYSSSRTVVDVMQRHVRDRFATSYSNKVYPSIEMAVETRMRTATRCPGQQWISKPAARDLVEWALLPSTSTTNNHDDPRIHPLLDYSTVGENGWRFRHDPRLVTVPLRLHTLGQVEEYWGSIACPVLWLRANDGWPFPSELLQRCEAQLERKNNRVTIQRLPGSHHFHLDPDTAGAVSDSIVQFLSSDW